MDDEPSNPITIFWSWQLDSPSNTNRNFIFECLKKSVADISKDCGHIINIERDTSGVGGSPSIVDTIFSKIRSADIFVWDATLVHSEPRPSPNANVLIEYGYALAIIGSGRIIGVYNIYKGSKPEDLPFDIRHARGPIGYSLGPQPNADDEKAVSQYSEYRKKVKDTLIKALSGAIKSAMKEERAGIFYTDSDFLAAKHFIDIIDSIWISNFMHDKENIPACERKETLDCIDKYIYDFSRPEFHYFNTVLSGSHNNFVKSLLNYRRTVSLEIVPFNEELFIITTKAGGMIEDYNKKYDRQVNTLYNNAKLVESAWREYICTLRSIYPEIIYQ